MYDTRICSFLLFVLFSGIGRFFHVLLFCCCTCGMYLVSAVAAAVLFDVADAVDGKVQKYKILCCVCVGVFFFVYSTAVL